MTLCGRCLRRRVCYRYWSTVCQMDYAQGAGASLHRAVYSGGGAKAQLGGNSVGMDKRFLERYMPEVMAHLHYRVIDVSTIKELASRWYPAAHHSAPAKTGNHRAMGDIKDSIDELVLPPRYFCAAGPGRDCFGADCA